MILEEIVKKLQTKSKEIIQSISKDLKNLSKDEVKVIMKPIISSRSSIALTAVQDQLDAILEETSPALKKYMITQLLGTRCEKIIEKLVLKHLPSDLEEVKVFLKPIFLSRSKSGMQFIRNFLPSLSIDEVKDFMPNLIACRAPDEMMKLIPHLGSIFNKMSPSDLKSSFSSVLSAQSKVLVEIVSPHLEKIKGTLDDHEKTIHLSKIMSAHSSTRDLKSYASDLLKTLPLDAQLSCIPFLAKKNPVKRIRNKLLKLELSEIIFQTLEEACEKNSEILLDKSNQNKIIDLENFNKEKSSWLKNHLDALQIPQKTPLTNQKISIDLQEIPSLSTSMKQGFSFFHHQPTNADEKSRTLLLHPTNSLQDITGKKRISSYLKSSNYEPNVQKHSQSNPDVHNELPRQTINDEQKTDELLIEYESPKFK